MRSFVTKRATLDPKTALLFKYVPLDELESGFQNFPLNELSIMASNLVYENEARIKKTVEDEWKMHFVRYFSCWNKYLEAADTHAFIFCDKLDDAQWIVIAIRGTVTLHDWRVDLDFSHLNTKVMGMVHEGFMKALGLQDEKNFDKGFPAEYSGDPDKEPAFNTITEVVNELMKKHTNAKILVTGHSLGGALSTLYASLLALKRKDVFDRVDGVVTFGQPRVGDKAFGEFLMSKLGEKYKRMVYRFDIVPRIPLDISLIAYKHFGDCIAYDGWFTGKRVEELPDPNFFNILYWPLMYWDAIVDFFMAIWLGIRKGEWEGLVATISRFIWIIFPGVAFHNTLNYIKATRMAKVTYKI